jgi:glycosyltransferase involved in cell wall biosynthesis
VIGQAAAIIDPENVDSMAQQLSSLGTDSGLRERLVAAGLVQAKKYDWRRTAEETLKVYELAAHAKR